MIPFANAFGRHFPQLGSWPFDNVGGVFQALGNGLRIFAQGCLLVPSKAISVGLIREFSTFGRCQDQRAMQHQHRVERFLGRVFKRVSHPIRDFAPGRSRGII